MSIYGPGDTPSPHFLCQPTPKLWLFQHYPGMCTPGDLLDLCNSGQIQYDELAGKYVVVPPKPEAAAAMARPKARGRKKR